MIYKTDDQCPIITSYSVPVPKNVPSGPAIFAWSWIPVSSGQKEYYMTCSKVNVYNSEISYGQSFLGAPLVLYNMPGYPDYFCNDNGKTFPWVETLNISAISPYAVSHRSSYSRSDQNLLHTSGSSEYPFLSSHNALSISSIITDPSPSHSEVSQIVSPDIFCEPGKYQCKQNDIQVCTTSKVWVAISCGPNMKCSNIGDSYVCV